MLTIEREALLRTAEATGWDLGGHIEWVYDTFCFRGGTAPPLVVRAGETRPAIQQSLMDWKADLGARDRMDWPGFLEAHQRILQGLAPLPRLGQLRPHDIDAVCAVVDALEGFKKTSGRALVFGSKAAHFHFPWLVPVTSSEVIEGLRWLEQRHPADIDALIPGTGQRFEFNTPANRLRSYRNYVVLGNALTARIDSSTFFGDYPVADYDLHAKIFEWWVISAGWA
jgi:hypothetical protein